MFIRVLISVLFLSILIGCSAMATRQLTDNLVSGMLNQDDPATVRAAIPAYLVLLDGLIQDDPENPQLLISASQLYGAFAGGLIDDPVRSTKLIAHSKKYARKALCIQQAVICDAEDKNFSEFTAALDNVDNAGLDALYAYATSYANWIRGKRDDWNMLMDLPKVEAMLQKVIDLDPGYAQGRAQLYLAVMRSQLPQALGGKPELGRSHFELALDYSNRKDLMVKVEYARTYARLVFNQELHDRLLGEVISTDPVVKDLTLSNILAQEKAQTLMNDGYF
jgi:hypothetical protein